MMPFLMPGTLVLVTKGQLSVGSIILVVLGGHEMARRVVGVSASKVTVVSDHDPKTLTTISRDAVVGVVTRLLPGAVPAPRPYKPHARLVAAIVALVLIAMVAAQLVTFEEFSIILGSYGVVASYRAELLGALLTILSVATLPYLLHMTLSRAARVVSIVSGWIVGISWLLLGVFAMLTPSLSSTGHLGGLVVTPPGVWAIVFGVLLCVAIGVAQWMLGVTRPLRSK